MKVLIVDEFDSSGIDSLKQIGCDIAFHPDTTADTMPEVIGANPADVLIVRGTKISADAIQQGSSLCLIVRAGAGYDSIDVAEASRRGIFVANCPGKNSIAVAEIAWGLILSCDRMIPDQTADLRNGVWNKSKYSKAAGLFGRTLGVIGTGQIGMEIARRGLAFGMHVVGWSRSLRAEKAKQLGIGFCADLAELAAQSDVVSVSVASNPQTTNLIDEKFLGAMKPGAMLINTSRGSVVDSVALANAIKAKNIRAGLDVFANEPSSGSEFSDPIVKLDGVYGTHHVGASTDQAQQAIADEAVRVIEQYKNSGRVCNCVNLAKRTKATTVVTIRHLNQPGVLAHIFETIGDAEINVEEMENIIYDGAEAACAKIQLDDALSESHLNAIEENPNVLSVQSSRLADS